LVERAIGEGVNFLLDNRPAEAAYPNGENPKPSGNWWKFGFPIFYVSDILQIAEAMAGLGYARDPRLTDALRIIESKQDEQGRWLLEYRYGPKTHGDFGRGGQPNKWVTLRALRVLKAARGVS
jgi:hypothetical protein